MKQATKLAVGVTTLMAATATSSIAAASACTPPHAPHAKQKTVTRVFARGGALTGPDDIVQLDGHIFVAFQNGVGAKGEPATNGRKTSTVVEYARSGRRLAQWNLTGKVDGMGADARHHRIIATVNEDANSSLYTISPERERGRSEYGAVRHYRYSANPLPHGGGTDSVVVRNGAIFITASAPAADRNGKTFSGAALYRVTLDDSVATVKPVLKDNAVATNAVTGARTTLNLSDPDSSLLMPRTSPRFAGDLMLDSQGDGQAIFLAHPGTRHQRATVLNLSTQVDDSAVATGRGSLFVVDSGKDQIIEISGRFTPGEVFASVPKDSTTLPGTLGLMNLRNGEVTAYQKVSNPKGLLFVR